MRRRSHIVLPLASWAILAVVAILLRGGTTLALEQRDPAIGAPGWPAVARTALEAGVYGAMLLGLLARVRVRRAVRTLGPAPALVGGVLIAGVLFAQLAKVAFYPFAPWTMYSAARPDCAISYFEVIGQHRDGRRTVLNPAALFPTLGDGLEVKLGHLIGDGTRLDDRAVQLCTDMLRAIAGRRSRDLRGDPLIAVHLYHTTVDHRHEPMAPQRRLILTAGDV